MKLVKETTQTEQNLKQTVEKNVKIKLWNDNFKELLGKPPISTSNDESTLTIQNKLDIKKGHCSIDELKKSIKSIQNGKSVGLDEIPAQVWKLGEFQKSY